MAKDAELSILVKLVDQASSGLAGIISQFLGLDASGEKAAASLLKLAGVTSIAALAFKALKDAYDYVQEAMKAFGDMGEQLTNLSLKTGMSSEALSVWIHAAKMSGADAGTVETAYRGLVQQMSAAVGGSREAERAFSDMGLSISELMAMSPDASFKAVANAIAAIPDPVDRAAAALEIYGRAGLTMLPLLAQNQEEWARSAQESHVLISEAFRAAAKEFDDSCDKMDEAARGLQLQIGYSFSEIGKSANGLAAAFMRDMTEMIVSFDKLGWAFSHWDFSGPSNGWANYYADMAKNAEDSAAKQTAAADKVKRAWGIDALPSGMNYTPGGWLAPYIGSDNPKSANTAIYQGPPEIYAPALTITVNTGPINSIEQLNKEILDIVRQGLEDAAARNGTAGVR